MNRYFLEVSYHGGRYAGSQVQLNALTIQAEIEKALAVYFRQPLTLTGSSRTDAGVHARQNFYHFDLPMPLNPRAIYNLNAILPADIAIKQLIPVPATAHCRFDAVAREYEYYIYQYKDPFLVDRAWYYPYTIDWAGLQTAAGVVKEYTDFTSFSKRNSQVRTFNCNIMYSEWKVLEQGAVFRVKANRFLRGMVRGLVGTMLQVGRGKITVETFRQIIEAKDCTKADFSVPGHGLFLQKVEYPEHYFSKS
ncbi:tRNA pseudouridine(38-40) synthase TruA [Niastella populi]|uniref:tRNA pseudouridine synthase A n=1 Tax=Niastella populi TaxID=550983 RepID=A0A1V9EGW0_9BACT|nr:tRNA pseudouridine(38-40) synthase TruA [Niastella populi]OQP45174.1 tRNA pseudouridine(38-40) synthase TruA [Niastella populi]